MLEHDKKIAPVNPYLVVDSVQQAADYYFQAFGARQAERYEDHNGKVWYSVLKIFGAPLQLMEPDEGMGMVSKDPKSDEPDSFAINIDVTNVDKTFNRVIKAGADVIAEPEDADWGGRTSEIRDPFGHRWIIGPRLRKKDRRRSPLAPQIVAEDVDEAVAWWQRVFGTREARRIKGTVRPEVPFTVIRLGGAALQITAPNEARKLAPAPRDRDGSDSSMITVVVPDVDTTFERAVSDGAIPIVEPQDAYWGDRYAEFRDRVSGLRVSSCGETTLADAVVNPADLQRKLDEFLDIHGKPSSPAGPVGVQNVNT